MPSRANCTPSSRDIASTPPLRRGVGDLRGRRAHAGHERRRVDDRAAPARLHVRDRGLAAEVDRGQVDLLHPAPGVEAGGEDRVVVRRGDAGVVERDVQPAVRVDAPPGTAPRPARARSRRPGRTARRPPRPRPCRPPGRRRRRRRARPRPRTGGRWPARCRCPAGDDRDPVDQPSHHCLLATIHSFRREEDVLLVGERVQRVRAELAAEAGLLEAAERRRVAHRRVRVDRQVAGLDRRGRPAAPGPGRGSRSSRTGRTRPRWRCRTASSSSSNGTTATTGPKISSVTARSARVDRREHRRREPEARARRGRCRGRPPGRRPARRTRPAPAGRG